MEYGKGILKIRLAAFARRLSHECVLVERTMGSLRTLFGRRARDFEC